MPKERQKNFSYIKPFALRDKKLLYGINGKARKGLDGGQVIGDWRFEIGD